MTRALYSQPPSASLIDRQYEWEGENITMGLERYRAGQFRRTKKNGEEATRAVELGDTAPGTEIIRDVCPLLIPAIEAERQVAIDSLSQGKRGGQPEWWWLISLLPADALAFLTCRVVLSCPFNDYGASTRMTSAALAAARAVQDEIEFRNWRRKSARNADENDAIDMALLLTRRCKGDVTRARFQKWKSKIAEIERLDWTKTQRVSIGVKLIHLAIEHGGGWFEARHVRTSGRATKNEIRIFLSDDARRAIASLDEHYAFGRPYLLPMIAPPRPWERKEPKEIRDGQ